MFASSSSNSNWVDQLNPNSNSSRPPHHLPPASTSHFLPCFNHNIQDRPYDQFLESNHETPIGSNHMGFQEKGTTSSLAVFSSSPFPTAARSTKKEKHSKICTARGVRDRRVRLSIGIAREFFGLQDMLGYDKASKTLEWLLDKSKKAIGEIARSKKHQIAFPGNYSAGRHGAVPEGTGHLYESQPSDLSQLIKEDMKEMQLQDPGEETWEKAREMAARDNIFCFTIPNGSAGLQTDQLPSRVHASPTQYQHSTPTTPYDLTPLNGELVKNNFLLGNLPQNWETNYDPMIRQPASFILEDSVPYM
ncbi:hypothetical protein SAY87_026551 [Trapa incisa]|uniref:TCP domain-containing protein n=1 Tax=Trapa incisa TaxID=236973 RepID=A0AAN7GY09_9MYRT|nr:hypothetical protein SAY87_026551 [Trapa incisa]